MKRNHDIKPGTASHCQVCFSQNLEIVVDLGHQPLCDSLLNKNQLNEPESTFPLRLLRCPECSLAQLDYVVPGELVYHLDYPYRCGITREVVEHHEESSRNLIKQLSLNSSSLVVDIGSNDGTLLKGFKAGGVRVLGVEPTNVAKIAAEAGVETIQNFFTEKLAKEIASSHGKAKLITSTNVFAHMATLGEVLRGIVELLDGDGVLMTETHSLLDIVERNQYDTIYHEHLRSYSLKSLYVLLEQYGLRIIRAERVDRYGGSLRILACRKNAKFNSDESVNSIIEMENRGGLYDGSAYIHFKKNIVQSKLDLLEKLLAIKHEGKSVVGNSCPGRASTLLNYVGIDQVLLPYIAEQPSSLKLGHFLAGKHIPIVKNDILFDEQPDYVLLLAWHYAQPISEQLRSRGLKSRFIVPLPYVHELKI